MRFFHFSPLAPPSPAPSLLQTHTHSQHGQTAAERIKQTTTANFPKGTVVIGPLITGFFKNIVCGDVLYFAIPLSTQQQSLVESHTLLLFITGPTSLTGPHIP